jgi:vacuolar protein sorting-associated protein 35
MLYNDDPEEMFKIVNVLKKHFLTGGPKRLKFTIPPLVVSTLKLIRRLPVEGDNPFGKEASVTATKIFQFLNQVSFITFHCLVCSDLFLGRTMCLRATLLF